MLCNASYTDQFWATSPVYKVWGICFHTFQMVNVHDIHNYGKNVLMQSEICCKNLKTILIWKINYLNLCITLMYSIRLTVDRLFIRWRSLKTVEYVIKIVYIRVWNKQNTSVTLHVARSVVTFASISPLKGEHIYIWWFTSCTSHFEESCH